MKCPKCKDSVGKEISRHFRFHHWYDSDEIVDILFTEITKLNDRVTNLCELLEIKEK